MHLLALDTLGESVSVAVTAPAGVLAERSAAAGHGQAEALLPLVQAAMRDAGLGFADLDALAVATGPGGFTSVRTGVAAARGLALAAGLPVFAVDRLEALIAAAREAGAVGTVAAVHDARRGEVALALAFPDGLLERPEGLLTTAAAAGWLRERAAGRSVPPTLVGDGAAAVVPALDEGTRMLAVRASARHVAAVAQARHDRGEVPVAGSLVRPFYVRPPDARPDAGRPLVVAA